MERSIARRLKGRQDAHLRLYVFLSSMRYIFCLPANGLIRPSKRSRRAQKRMQIYTELQICAKTTDRSADPWFTKTDENEDLRCLLAGNSSAPSSWKYSRVNTRKKQNLKEEHKKHVDTRASTYVRERSVKDLHKDQIISNAVGVQCSAWRPALKKSIPSCCIVVEPVFT